MEEKTERERSQKSKPGARGGSAKPSNPRSKNAQVGSSKGEGFFRAIAEGAGDAIIVLDNEGKVSYWNPASEKIFGYSSHEVTAKTLENIVPKRYHKDYREAVEVLREGRKKLRFEKSFESEALRQDGTEFPVEVSVSTILFNGLWHAVGIIRDITDRRRAQEEVRETLAKYQIMSEHQKDAIIMVDMDTQKFLEVNKAAVNVYGYSREDFLSMTITDIFSETEDDLDAGMPRKANIFVHRRKDGTIFPVEITACVFSWKGRKTFCAITRDITESQLSEIK
jgi:two-component system cell cycle sensor histidine kinase/response regulator CckA